MVGDGGASPRCCCLPRAGAAPASAQVPLNLSQDVKKFGIAGHLLHIPNIICFFVRRGVQPGCSPCALIPLPSLRVTG